MFERLSYKTKKGGKIKGLHHACPSAHVIIIAFFPGNKTRQLTAHARPMDNSGRVLTFNPHIMFNQIKDRARRQTWRWRYSQTVVLLSI